MHMPKRLEREPPQRPLCDRREKRIPQLLEPDVQCPRDAVGNSQTDGPKRKRRHAFPGKRIDRPLIKNWRGDRDQLGTDQHDHRQHNPDAQGPVIRGPEIRRDGPDDANPRPPGFPGRIRIGVRHERSLSAGPKIGSPPTNDHSIRQLRSALRQTRIPASNVTQDTRPTSPTDAAMAQSSPPAKMAISRPTKAKGNTSPLLWVKNIPGVNWPERPRGGWPPLSHLASAPEQSNLSPAPYSGMVKICPG